MTPPEARVDFTLADIERALEHYDEALDVSPEDLEQLFRQVEIEAHQRRRR